MQSRRVPHARAMCPVQLQARVIFSGGSNSATNLGVGLGSPHQKRSSRRPRAALTVGRVQRVQRPGRASHRCCSASTGAPSSCPNRKRVAAPHSPPAAQQPVDVLHPRALRPQAAARRLVERSACTAAEDSRRASAAQRCRRRQRAEQSRVSEERCPRRPPRAAYYSICLRAAPTLFLWLPGLVLNISFPAPCVCNHVYALAASPSRCASKPRCATDSCACTPSSTTITNWRCWSCCARCARGASGSSARQSTRALLASPRTTTSPGASSARRTTTRSRSKSTAMR